MIFKDLREFLNLLEEKNELVRIKEEVDWDEEIGALSQEAIFKNAPASINLVRKKWKKYGLATKIRRH